MKLGRLITPLVGQKIEIIRKEKGLTQQQLADSINVSRTQLCNMEVGKCGTTLDTVYLIACVLKCEVGDLFPPIQEVEKVVEEKEVTVLRKVVTFKLKDNN